MVVLDFISFLGEGWRMERQRRFTRVDFTVNALVKGEDTAFRGEVTNLSLHGIFIRTDTSMPVGSPAEVTICLTEIRPEVLIHVNATVVRCEPDGIALKFARIDVDSFTHLRSIIAYQKGDGDAVMDEFIDYVEENIHKSSAKPSLFRS
jgi:hypothetical protein